MYTPIHLPFVNVHYKRGIFAFIFAIASILQALSVIIGYASLLEDKFCKRSEKQMRSKNKSGQIKIKFFLLNRDIFWIGGQRFLLEKKVQ